MIRYCVVLLLLVSSAGYAQIDQRRMDRDLEIAEKILQTLAQQNSDGSFWVHSANSSYVDGFGVILTVPNYFGLGGVAVYSLRGNNLLEDDDDRKDEDEPSAEEQREQLIAVVKTFLVDYGDLIGQLEPTDKIMVTQKEEKSFVLLRGLSNAKGVVTVDSDDDKKDNGRISIEISKQDLIDLKQGKISREAALKKVVVTEKDEPSEKMPDLELFASILSRLYKSDLSESYSVSGNPGYEILPNFGVIYSMRVYTSRRNSFYYAELAYSQSQNRDRDKDRVDRDRDRAERDARAKELYPTFVDDMKKNIVEYGRTIRSLKSDEMLMVKVTISGCRDCGIPKSLDFSIKKSVLDQYAKGSINLDAAADKVILKEHSTD